MAVFIILSAVLFVLLFFWILIRELIYEFTEAIEMKRKEKKEKENAKK